MKIKQKKRLDLIINDSFDNILQKFKTINFYTNFNLNFNYIHKIFQKPNINKLFINLFLNFNYLNYIFYKAYMVVLYKIPTFQLKQGFELFSIFNNNALAIKL